MISVIIPARHEPYLQHTIDDVLGKAKSEIEVIAVLDGYWPDPAIRDDERVSLIHHSEFRGMRGSINDAAGVAKGKYLLKLDAHCMVDDGFDVKLLENMQDDWLVVPRRYDFDIKKWKPNKKRAYDFQYIHSPFGQSHRFRGANWPEYEERVNGDDVADLMTFQGSCWFVNRDKFFELGGEDEVNYGWRGKEAQELCLKWWLSGGRCVVNRKTWYAHWKKKSDELRKMYSFPKEVKQKSEDFAIDFWMNDRWPLAKRKFQWLLDKFNPIPTWKEKDMPKKETVTDVYGLLRTQRRIMRKDSLPIVVKRYKRSPHLYKLMDIMGLKKGVEVGVRKALNARQILKNIPGVDLTLVDPWIDYDGLDSQRTNKYHSGMLEIVQRDCAEQIKSGQVKIARGFSMDRVKDFADGSLDFVYIDGNHCFDYVMQDLIEWSRKVRSGGLVSGHDFYNFRKGGVVPAVTTYTRNHRIKQWFITEEKCSSFFWVKP